MEDPGHPAQSLCAGDAAGVLTEEGARLLDPTGQLQAGIPLCPPEGDAGTGMVATNSVAERTGNVSAGTSVFAMIVLEKPLSKVYPEIDMVTTPTGKPVAMVHSNNCTSDLNAWVELFQEFTTALGVEISQSRLFEMLYQKALRAMRMAAGCLPTIIFRASISRTLRKGVRCSSVHPKAVLPFRISCACICSRRLGP